MHLEHRRLYLNHISKIFILISFQTGEANFQLALIKNKIGKKEKTFFNLKKKRQVDRWATTASNMLLDLSNPPIGSFIIISFLIWWYIIVGVWLGCPNFLCPMGLFKGVGELIVEIQGYPPTFWGVKWHIKHCGNTMFLFFQFNQKNKHHPSLLR